jgi:uncharacterized repeat protein (TIGR03803 family)
VFDFECWVHRLFNWKRGKPQRSRPKWNLECLEDRLTPSSYALTTSASFNGTNGAIPNGSLVEDSSGNLFGTAQNGGASSDGDVFEINHGSGVITTLASFNGTNGANPVAGLIEDSSGNLFGTTLRGGASSDGTVFEVFHNSGVITTLASFNGTDGQNSFGGLVEDGSGNLFGATSGGGASSNGTVFEILHNSGVITTLASFDGTHGADPLAGLVLDSGGNLFGTTSSGGASSDGTVFEVVHNSGVITTLASFNGTNGSSSFAGLVEDSSGNLFGTTLSGGASSDGTIFEILHNSGVITPLASFNGTNGANPLAGLIEDSGGNLFGTTSNGGASGDGTAFEIVHGSGVITTLASFNGTNGANPNAGLVEDSSGNFFGSTENGGASGNGVVFKVAPPPIAADFPGLGVYLNIDGVWTSLHTTTDATSLAVDAYGDVVAAFGSAGVSLYTNGAWTVLSKAVASDVDIAGNDIIVANFPGFGVYRNETGTAAGWQRLGTASATSVAVDAAGEVVASYNNAGVYLINTSGAIVKIAAANATQVAIAGNNIVAAQFTGLGLYEYQGTTWTRLSTNTATSLGVDANGDVAAAFGGNGVYLYQNSGSVTTKIANATASIVSITIGDGGPLVVGEFPGYGLYLTPFSNPRIAAATASQLSIGE